MEKRYKRVDKIESKIQSAKLPYNAWKVLFLLDDETAVSDITGLLDESDSDVEQALDVLENAGLVEQLTPESAETEAKEQPEEAPAPSVTETMEEKEAEEEVTPAAEQTPEEMPEPEQKPAAEEIEAADEEQPETVTEVEEPVEEETEKSEVMADQPLAEETAEEEKEGLDLDELIEKEEEKEEDVPVTEDTVPVEEPQESTVEHDLDIQIPTEPETATEEKETLDVDFELNQPEVSEEEPAETVAEETAPQPKPAPAGDMKTILVIDDSIVIRKMVEIALEDEESIQIETSISGKEGLDKMDNVSPDLVILDMMLPDINGVEILKTIKASKGIPVIMLSGKDSPQLVEKAKSEGADEFLPKPFRDDELVDKIKQLLGMS